jgi:hypothetical protein
VNRWRAMGARLDVESGPGGGGAEARAIDVAELRSKL